MGAVGDEQKCKHCRKASSTAAHERDPMSAAVPTHGWQYAPCHGCPSTASVRIKANTPKHGVTRNVSTCPPHPVARYARPCCGGPTTSGSQSRSQCRSRRPSQRWHRRCAVLAIHPRKPIPHTRSSCAAPRRCRKRWRTTCWWPRRRIGSRSKTRAWPEPGWYHVTPPPRPPC